MFYFPAILTCELNRPQQGIPPCRPWLITTVSRVKGASGRESAKQGGTAKRRFVPAKGRSVFIFRRHYGKGETGVCAAYYAAG